MSRHPRLAKFEGMILTRDDIRCDMEDDDYRNDTDSITSDHDTIDQDDDESLTDNDAAQEHAIEGQNPQSALSKIKRSVIRSAKRDEITFKLNSIISEQELSEWTEALSIDKVERLFEMDHLLSHGLRVLPPDVRMALSSKLSTTRIKLDPYQNDTIRDRLLDCQTTLIDLGNLDTHEHAWKEDKELPVIVVSQEHSIHRNIGAAFQALDTLDNASAKIMTVPLEEWHASCVDLGNELAALSVAHDTCQRSLNRNESNNGCTPSQQEKILQHENAELRRQLDAEKEKVRYVQQLLDEDNQCISGKRAKIQ